MKVRRGIITVGQTNSGKSTISKLLQAAVNSLKQYKVESYIINPKSLTIGQIFGEVVHEWKDGILPRLIRQFNRTFHETLQQWIILDGPCDVEWVENLNNVLDDNKKLCLSNGQMLPIHNNVRFILEVEDLQNASIATISRCGSIYMDINQLGIEPLITSWILSLPFNILRYGRIKGQL